ncbi:hypothetical protein [uncultured Massilia sp.]|uniref:hypothetical protein n=1 Tax=uncultured Massilia sp. TaxID=169973 RepID=UPI00258C109F|nr:hypothetical protein [uncultured Massilia sp.]
MRTKLLIASAIALMSLNASADDSGAATVTHDAGAGRVNVVGAQPTHKPLAAMTYAGVQGVYVLDDGRRLRVTGKSAGKARTLYADLGDGPVEMVQVGHGRFVGAERGLGLSFEDYVGAHPSTVQVTSAPQG